MLTKNNKYEIELGSTYIKTSEKQYPFYGGKGEASSIKYIVSRLESITLDGGLEQINSIILKNGTVSISVDLQDFLNDYECIARANIYKKMSLEYKNAKNQDRQETRELIHKIDKTVAALRGKTYDKGREFPSKESLHLDVGFLSSLLGDVVVFKKSQWLANIIYQIDRLGGNYGATISRNAIRPLKIETITKNTGGEIFSNEDYGYLIVSSKNKIKTFINNKLIKLLKYINRNEEFSQTNLKDYNNETYTPEEGEDKVRHFKIHDVNSNSTDMMAENAKIEVPELIVKEMTEQQDMMDQYIKNNSK